MTRSLSFLAARVPTLCVGLALAVAIVTANAYLGTVEQQAIREIDTENLARLDELHQQHYLRYRQHEVNAQAALQLVLQEWEWEKLSVR